MNRNIQIGSLLVISILGFGFSFLAIWPLLKYNLNAVPLASLPYEELN